MVRVLTTITVAMLIVMVLGKVQAQQPIWIESEKPASINTAAEISDWGFPKYLSNGKWIHISIPADKVRSLVGSAGVTVTYYFSVHVGGVYHIWNRLGYERVRSPFTWTVDGQKPTLVSPLTPTTDLMEMQPWNEIAWLNMGAIPLDPGRHLLTIHVPATQDAKGKWNAILYASDCLCICRRQFHPHGKYPPGVWPQSPVDLQAARTVFTLHSSRANIQRIAVPLKGEWQVTRSDEVAPRGVSKPISRLPLHPFWSAIPVPGDKNTLRPDLLFAHRLWYRTRIEIPTSLGGRGFYLLFPQNNLNTTVFVNGKYCGFNPNPFVRFHIDISREIHPGLNTVMVGIRDAWYGFETEPGNPAKLRDEFNLPISFFHEGFQHLAYPIWNHPESGILATPVLVCTGRVYTSNIFVIPKVLTDTLTVHATIDNSTSKLQTGVVKCTVYQSNSSVPALNLPSSPFTVMPFSTTEVVVKGVWHGAHRWTPEQPFMYSLHSTIYVSNKPLDRNITAFGYRQWTISGTQFLLNGHPFHGWQDNFQASNQHTWLALYRKYHETMYRFWGTSWMGMTPDHALDYFDRHGIVVRRQGMLDGEAIGYMAIEDDPLLQKLYHSPINMELMRNWQRQVTAEVRGERNHPSIMIWSIENEFLYINCINLYRNLMKQFEAAVTQVANAVMKVDPTRPVMVDGGGACKAQTLPVCGNHYIDGKWTDYPDLAYEANATGGGRNRWVWDQKRPRFVGEDYFMTGNHPGLSALGGEIAQTGKTGTMHATALVETFLQQGYRWAGYGAWDFYDGPDDTDGSQYNSFKPRAVFCREWNWTFASGQQVIRRFGIFNDSDSNTPITFVWRLMNHQRQVSSQRRQVQLLPGTNVKFNDAIKMPVVTVRTDMRLELTLYVGGKKVFNDAKLLAVMPSIGKLPEMVSLRHLAKKGLIVYDPTGNVKSELVHWNIHFRGLSSLSQLPKNGRVLLVGSNSLDDAATGLRLQGWAAAGRTVIILEQLNPISSPGVIPGLEPEVAEGSVAFGQNYQNPIFKDLHDCDFFTWGPGVPLYNKVYLQPKAGAQSLLECGNLLKYSALLRVPSGAGRLLLCQLRLESNLRVAPARRMLFNLLTYAFSTPTPSLPTYLCTPPGGELARVVTDLGVAARRLKTPMEGIEHGRKSLEIVSASPSNLKELADHLKEVRKFTKRGGWIVLNGLTPQGLSDYDKLVGYNHMIRPFRREKVLFTYPRNSLTAGMSAADLTMYSNDRIFSWTAGNYVSQHEFSYVVDTNDAAPFAKFNNPFYENIVNGFVSSDGWPLIVDVPVPKSGAFTIDMKLPAARTLNAITWIGNTMYWPTTHITLRLMGAKPVSASFSVPPDNLPHRLQFAPVKCSNLQLSVDGWTPQPGIAALIGIDNINLWIKPTELYSSKVRPMVADGGMVEYPEGKGGLVLCNLWFKKQESVPLNAVKKRRLLGALLQNLHAQLAEPTASVAHSSKTFVPINLAGAANAFTGSRGWFGDPVHTFDKLPTGFQVFGGIQYSVYQFKTSPVPTCVLTGAPSAKGTVFHSAPISVNRTADELYFLQTARLSQAVGSGEVVGHYLVTYADGTKLEIPLRAHINIDNYLESQPQTLAGASTAWVDRWPDGKTAEAFTLKWVNPRPAKKIASIQLVNDHRDDTAIALLAISAGLVETYP